MASIGPKITAILEKLAEADTEKSAGLVGHVIKNVAKDPTKAFIAYRGTKKKREGKREHQKIMHALRSGYPAGWVALGMRPHGMG